MIRVEGLRFAYRRGAKPALDGLSFSVGSGEIFGFLGPSGAGKSTTQKILTGMIRMYEGEALIAGRAARTLHGSDYASIGVAYETPGFYQKLTGLENLRLFAAAYGLRRRDADRKAGELLERLLLADAAGTFVSAYSKGMRARLNLARALLHGPKILLLDEPTAGLDPVMTAIARDLIRERCAAGAACFLTTHDMSAVAALCDRIAFLVEGMVVESGAPSELARKYGRREARLEFQTESGVESVEIPLDELAERGTGSAIPAGRRLLSVHSLDATLDRVFIEATGRSLS